MIKRIESDVCYICGIETIRGWLFCEKCRPPVGKTIRILGNESINPFILGHGVFPDIREVLGDIQVGFALIRWWIGTDALILNTFPPGKFWWPLRIMLARRQARKIEPLITQHWADHECLIPDLLKFGIAEEKIRIVEGPAVLQRKLPKIPHKGFNVLYYNPKQRLLRGNTKYRRWKYGVDIIEEVKKRTTDLDINLIVADGSLNMAETYPITDYYARPARHDGGARMRMEAEINEIPYYFRRDFRPTARELEADIRRVCAQAKADQSVS